MVFVWVGGDGVGGDVQNGNWPPGRMRILDGGVGISGYWLC